MELLSQTQILPPEVNLAFSETEKSKSTQRKLNKHFLNCYLVCSVAQSHAEVVLYTHVELVLSRAALLGFMMLAHGMSVPSDT